MIRKKQSYCRIKRLLLISTITNLMFVFVSNACDNPQIAESTPDSRFTAESSSTLPQFGRVVIDTETKLMWAPCISGHTASGGPPNCTGVAVSLNWGEALQAAADYSVSVQVVQGPFGVTKTYDDWRLPNVTELKSLFEDCNAGPTINRNIFPGTPAGRFWTSTPSLGFSSLSIDFALSDGGFQHSDGRSTMLFTRFVRDTN